MKVYSIRNYGAFCPAQRNNAPKYRQYQTNSLNDEPKSDTLTFKGNVGKGMGWGAAYGLFTIAALSLASGGLAAPIVLAAGALGGSIGGGLMGNEIDKMKEDDKK